MKKRNITIAIIVIFVLIIISLIIINYAMKLNSVACTNEAKICQDGTDVGREGLKCEFTPCPDLVYCDAVNKCDEDYECYKFEDNENPYCFKGDPCIKCGSNKCAVAESFPEIVYCAVD